jgi:hypothetical protein
MKFIVHPLSLAKLSDGSQSPISLRLLLRWRMGLSLFSVPPSAGSLAAPAREFNASSPISTKAVLPVTPVNFAAQDRRASSMSMVDRMTVETPVPRAMFTF